MVEKRQFAKAFQQLDKTFSSASVYFDFHRENLEKEFAITEAEIESYYGKYVNVLEELRADNHENDDEEDDPIDIEYMLRTHSIEEINYRYILSLIQQFLPKDKKKAFSGVEKNKEHKEIDNYIAILEKENPELSILMHSLWKMVEQNPEVYRGKNITELLEQKIGERTTDLVNDFAKKWAIEPDKLHFVVDNYNPGKTNQNGEDELRNTSNYRVYKENAETPVTKLRYWKSIKQAYTDMIKKEVLPLRMK